MTPQQRIRLARRHAGLSQAELGKAVGVQRSAVTHWEATQNKSPSVRNLRAVALATQVHFEWLATGRGAMALSEEVRLDSIAAVNALLVEDPLEMRVVEALRESTTQARIALAELAEQLAAQRTGRRKAQVEAAVARVAPEFAPWQDDEAPLEALDQA